MSERATNKEIIEGMSRAFHAYRSQLEAGLTYVAEHNDSDKAALMQVLQNQITKTDLRIAEMNRQRENVYGPERYQN